MMPATCRPLPAPVPSPRNQPRRNRTAASVSSAAALTMSQDGYTFHEPARRPLWASPARRMDKTEERGVGEECVSMGRSRGSPDNIKNKNTNLIDDQEDK